MQRIRWPKTLSPFSGSDSDSDGQVDRRSTRNGRNLHIAIPNNDSNPSKAIGAPIMAVYLFCTGDQPSNGYSNRLPSDPIFSSTPLPISVLLGVPLLMRRLLAKPAPSSPHFENPLASQLQIDPAESTNQSPRGSTLGTVLIVRADKEPLQKELVDRICAYHAKLLSLAQQRGPGGMTEVVKTMATPEKFLAFCMESFQSGSGNIANSVHEMLGGSWLDLQRPMASV
ncbi:SubName: Full=Uncharacterized protein {ECO:0000313/EMBL:CCA77854.1} [Serendipita indica DSM 11827]|nr:SubName: Full=Uncharacterized protein {ECO:0000313/EMBL:CCA77854.1} [Serendipita indica DSM 11827]